MPTLRRTGLLLTLTIAALVVATHRARAQSPPSQIWPEDNRPDPALDQSISWPADYDSVSVNAELASGVWTPSNPPEQPGLSAAAVASEEFLAGETAGAPSPEWQFTVGWLAPGGQNGFGTTDIDVHRTSYFSPFPNLAPLVVTPGFGSHSWNGPRSVDLPAQVFDAYLDLSWQIRQWEQTQLRLGVTPGLYGDFQKVDGQSFQLTGWLLGDWSITNRLTLVGGVACVRQLRTNILPVGGIIWATPDTRVELLVPSPRVARRWRTGSGGDTWIYLAGQFGGGSWAILQPDGSNVRLTYSDLRLSLGLEWFGVGRYSGSAEVGYAFARDISAFDTTLFLPNGTGFIQAGLSF